MNRTLVIKMKGKLDPSWREWFDGLEIIAAEDHTILKGEARDEAFVHGVLTKIRDLNLKLISVEIMDKAKDDTDNNKE